MISAFANTWKVPELRDRILFTLALIVIVRLGVHVTLPGVDSTVIDAWMSDVAKNEDSGSGAGIGAMLGIFSGGALQQAGVFALGIMPYISASIMLQLLTAVVPKLARLSREDNGRQKITQYTRFITIAIAVVQGYFVTKTLLKPEQMPYMQGIDITIRRLGHGLVADPSMLWTSLTVLTLVAGTLLLMWIADQMTDRGIGNGTSIIITVNIIASLPGALVKTWQYFIADKNADTFRAVMMLVMIVMLLVVIAGTIAITQAQRKIAIQYAKRVVGRKQFGGQTQYLPLKVNYAGVMPIIFASAILSLPPMLLRSMFPHAAWSQWLLENITAGGWYYVIAAFMIFFFSYFWVAMMFQPSQISEDLKRNGGYIPGVRPGKPTADFLEFTMTRLTFAGAIFLTLIFLLPTLVGAIVKLPASSPILHFFGGTSLLILVGVVLDVMRQVETHLLQRHYDGFLRKGKLKGRYDRLAQTGSAASSNTLIYLWAGIGLLVVIGTAAWLLEK
jgi:preprotein translocase subunit SecY